MRKFATFTGIVALFFCVLVVVNSRGASSKSLQYYCGVPLYRIPSGRWIGTDRYAAYFPGTRWILISDDVTGPTRRVLLLHECGHVKRGRDECLADGYAGRALGLSTGAQAEPWARRLGALYGAYRYRQFMRCFRS